jgi:23S rRNA pseudouridine1911/1915/1917 synthase
MTPSPEQPDAPLPAEVDEAEQDVEHFAFHVSKNITRRIDQYLTDRISYLSRSGVQRLIGEGLCKVNGRVVKSSYHPRTGDQIEIVAPPEPVNEIDPEPIPLEIVYEDEHFLALNKQANLMVHPARGVWHGTLVNGLIHYGSKWSGLNGAWRPGILHRLDRNTTGIMLVAKSDEAHWRIARQFETRTIQKTYLAIAHGIPQLLGDIIDMPIGQDRYAREKQAVRKIENGGRPATTKYQVLETFGSAADGFCYVQLSPKTGRTHQLRVHMTTLGHPLVGDTMYGGRVFESGSFRMERQALHAAQISFIHPISLQQMTLCAPLPPDFNRLLEILRSTKADAKT